MKRKLYLLTFLMIYSFCFSQEKSTVDYYVDYFKFPRETLFLHTNKTTYMPGEEIWFKVYAYDRKSQLTSKATTNIQLSIFDAEGNHVDQRLYHAKEGFAHGNIVVDDTFKTGNYFIKVGTNFMKNFKEDDTFVKKISIINQRSAFPKIAINTKEYDIQFLPEGGHLLTGVKNVVGVKVIDDTGKGIRASGVILDKRGKEVATFKSNFLGLGRFSFVPKKGMTYTAKISLENTKDLSLPLPEAKNSGISLTVNNTQATDVIIDFNTNEASFETVKNQAYKLFRSRFTLTNYKEQGVHEKDMNITSERFLFWNPQAPDQGSLWDSAIRLSPEFYDMIMFNPTPLDMRALHALKSSSMALDVYMWLSHRTFYLSKPQRLPWKALAAQMGAEYGRLRDFRKKVQNIIPKIRVFWPDLRVNFDDPEIITLYPSKPLITPKEMKRGKLISGI